MLLLLRRSRLDPLIAAGVTIVIAIVIIHPLTSGGGSSLPAIVVLSPGVLRRRAVAWSLILTAAFR